MKKLTFSVLALVAIAACSSDAEDVDSTNVTVPLDGVTSTQLEAFRALEISTGRAWRWLQHEQHKTPMHLSAPRVGKSILREGDDPVKVTLSVLAENKALFKMRDPGLELASSRLERDEMGMTHARFQQMVHGVPVAGAEVMAHYDAQGRLTSIDANYIADLDGVDVNPNFDAADALATVKADIVSRSLQAGGGVFDEETLEPESQQLVVYASPEHRLSPRLAYQYKIRALSAEEPAIWIVTVDAKSGDILHQYNNLQTVDGKGTGVLGDEKTFKVSSSGGGFIMTDVSAGASIRTLTAAQQQVRGNPVTSNDPNTWDTNVPGAGAAVDAHFNAAAVYVYFKERHGRNAIDGSGGALISTVHFGRAFENAAWDGVGMLYGDGAQMFRPLSVSLDVVGHEFTHGVTEKTSNLVYENQPGALNEAVSDIFGAFIEHTISPDPTKNWMLGETAVRSGGPLRDMKDPGSVSQPQPAHMNQFVNTQQDNGGVHINSGIVNNAAYLMTVGGVNPVSKAEVAFGIGWEKSEKVWYRANAQYFMRTTNFGQAAQGVLQAAKDLGLTDNEINIVDCAFKATGIAQGTCATLVDPQGREPTTPDDDEGDVGDDIEDGDDPSGVVTGDDKKQATGATGTKRRRIVTTKSGCNAASGDVELGPLSAMLGVIVGLAVSRRRKR